MSGRKLTLVSERLETLTLIATYLKAGIRPKKATNTMNEMKRIVRIIVRNENNIVMASFFVYFVCQEQGKMSWWTTSPAVRSASAKETVT